MNIRFAERELRTKFGTFIEVLYYDGLSESVALVEDLRRASINVSITKEMTF